ncbi:MAG: DUF4296 domain-containing protein [Sediminibacterium sp.]|jgi:Domain of unknown function (DUF4296)
MRISGIFIAFLLTSFFACKPLSADKKVLPINSMKKIMWDMMQADEWYIQTSLKDSLHKRDKENIQLYEQIFSIHQTTRKQYYNSYHYYQMHPNELKELVDSLSAYAEREKAPPKPANPK